jgi:hypothetical protein
MTRHLQELHWPTPTSKNTIGEPSALSGRAGTGRTALLIVSKRHPAGFPMRDLGGSVVQRFAKERCPEPAAIDTFVATVMGAACELASVGPVG